ncbi:MAG TPA: tetratricopeptide repeat protein [Verrucomicrobiae bacterium]|nr:tetratricopeptide repeat protein [Verrucomicrobiae bacterium]
MQPLEPPDSHHLSAAIGWIELGNMSEAKTALGQLSPAARSHPDALEAWWVILAEEKDWSKGLVVANTLLEASPKSPTGWLHRAYALRRVKEGGLKAAWEALLPAFEKFPEESTIPYNLSCYACQMGQMEEARAWLQRAVKAGGIETIKRMALRDADLKPLWDEIKGI